jgi:PadR family transcriptional regulator PadR
LLKLILLKLMMFNAKDGSAMTVKKNEYKTWVASIIGLYIVTILEEKPAHGNKIAEAVKKRTFGMISPNPNALYPLLRAMEERGYISGNWDNPDTRNKRIYSITEQGVAYIPVLREKVREKLDELEQKIRILRKDLFDCSGEDR